MALPLVDPSDPTSLYPNGRFTSTLTFRCYCVAPMSVPGLSESCSRCSRFGCRNATQWHRFKARARCRPCGPPLGSRVRDAVAGIYESRSLRVKTSSTWAGWTRGISASTASTKPTSTSGNTAQSAPLGHATVMHVGSECVWERRQ